MNFTDTSIPPLHVRIIQAIKYLLRKKWIIIIMAVFGGVIGIVYSLIKKPLYTATLSFSLEEDKSLSGAGSLLGLAAQFGFDLGNVGGIFTGDNIIELFKSRSIIEKTLLHTYDDSKTSFADTLLTITNLRNSFNDLPAATFPPSDSAAFNRVQDSVMFKMNELISKDLLNVEKPDKKLNLYEVTFKSRDEKFSKLFCEKLVKEVSDFYTETKTKRGKLNVDILQKRADSLKTFYDRALYGRANILDANINSAFQLPMVGVQQKQTDITVLATAYAEIVKNLEVAKYSLLRETPLIQIIDTPRYPLKKKTYPMWLYVPLSIIGFVVLTTGFLLFIKLFAKARRMIIASV